MSKPLLVTVIKSTLQNAGPKAPMDICRILEQTGEIECVTFSTYGGNDFPVYLDLLDLLHKTVQSERKVILQYPMQPFAYHEKQEEFAGLLEILQPENTILLLHDMNHIRFQDREVYHHEMEWLGRFRYFIVHNRHMEQYLRNEIPDCQCMDMELFDYLCEDSQKKAQDKHQKKAKLEVVFAGNLSKDKASFLYQLEEENMCFYLNLYGKKAGTITNKNIRYMGSIAAEKLPNQMAGNLGLIWDGQTDALLDTSQERQYTRYNTPHKFSCYIAAGIPVIAWKDAAIADVIRKYQVGYLIENIYEINQIDLLYYDIFCENAKKLAEKIRSGYFTRRVFDALQKMED